jgi:hypothetical protein
MLSLIAYATRYRKILLLKFLKKKQQNTSTEDDNTKSKNKIDEESYNK